MAAWISEWLHKHKQRVVLNGEYSRLQDVLSGLHQGSVLGPTLFLIFVNVNDIDTFISRHIQKFADDCKVFVQFLQQHCSKKQDISNLCQWSMD